MFNAVDEFGIREVNEGLRLGGTMQGLHGDPTIEARKAKLLEEAMHGALRIAGLVSLRHTVCMIVILI